MNEEILNNIWNQLTSDGLTQSSFEDWSVNIQSSPEVQQNIHNYLFEQGLTQNDFDSWATNTGLKKKEETDMVSESVSGLSVLPSGEKDTLLEETFGKNEVTDFFGDLYRSGVQGVAQGATVDDALKIFSQGKEADSQDIEDYIKAVQGMESMPASDEMRSFQEIYQSKGGGLMGFMAGIYENPSVLPQIFTSSVASMIQPASVGAGVALGAAAGAATGGLGALPGFVAGLSGSLETALAFTEFLKEEMKGAEFTEENIRAVLENPAALSRIRKRAATRGVAIAAIDAITAGVAKGVTSTVAQTARVLPKLAGATVGGTIEAVGGGVGEATARYFADQEMDTAEILFEATAGTATAPLTVGTALYKIPKYTIGDTRVNEVEVNKVIDTATPQELVDTEIEIKNNDKLKTKLELAKRDAQESINTKKAIPNISEQDLTEMVGLTNEKLAKENNPSPAAKEQLKEINKRIKEITEKYAVQEPSPEEVDVQEQARDGEDVGAGDIVTDQAARETTPQEEEVSVEDTEIEEEVDVEEVKDLQYSLGIPETEQVTEEQVTKEQALKNLREKQKALRDLEAQINPDGPGSPSAIVLDKARREVDDAKAELSKLIKSPIAEQVTQEQVTEEQVTEEVPGTIDRFFGETIEETTEKVSDNLVVNRKEAVTDKTTEQLNREQSVLGIATTAAKAISKLLPNTRIVLHDSATDFQNFVSDAQAEAEFNPTENVIHVDLSKATEITVPHEVFHAVFLNKVKTDKKATRQADLLVKKLNGNVPQKVQQEIETFVAKYEGAPEVQNEERLAELMGILARDYTNLEQPAQNFIKTFLRTILRQFGVYDSTIESSFNSENDVVKLLQTLAKKVKTGEEITEVDVEILEDGTNPVGNPTEIRVPKPRQRKVKFNDSYGLSLVTPDKSVDILSLIKDINSKGEKVWFWVADQLGLGEFEGVQLDAGPSFAFEGDAVWASSKSVKSIQKNIDAADYLFIISGSPQVSLLFNKKVYDVFTQRLGDYVTFKADALATNPTKGIKDALNKFNSWEEMRNSPDRKKFLIALRQQEGTPNTEFHKLVKSLNGFVDVNELRDSFYKDNNFGLNDVMVVIKPTSAREGSQHSTYANEVLGEVIGVPDQKVNAFDIMPQEMVDKYQKELGASEKSQAVAPYGSGIREIAAAPRQRKATVEQVAQQYNMDNQGFIPKTANLSQLRRAVEPFGLGAQRARTDQFGRGGGLFLTRNGRKFNPFKTTTRRRISTIEGQDLSIEGIIRAGRDQGFSDPAIRSVLRGRGFTAAEINPAMELALLKDEVLPSAFQNIEQGAQEGLRLFRDLQSKLKTFTEQAERTKAEIRAKALELLQETDIYKNSPQITRDEMVLALDRSVGTRANQLVQKTIGKIKASIAGYKRGVKDLRAAQIELKNFVRSVLPTTIYSATDVKSALATITNIKSKADLAAASEKVLRTVERLRTKQKKLLVKDLLSFVITKAKGRKTRSNRSRAGGLDAQGKDFFTAVKNILKASPEQLEAEATLIQEAQQEIATAEEKEARGEKLLRKESSLLDRALAYELFGQIDQLGVEETQALFDDLRAGAKDSVQRLNAEKALQKQRQKQLTDKAMLQMKEDYPFLFNEDGTIKSQSEVEQQREQIFQEFRKANIFKGVQLYAKTYGASLLNSPLKFIRNYFAHLGSVTEILDRYKDKGFFKEQLYDKVNIMDENSLRGQQIQRGIINDIANSIDGITNGFTEILSKFKNASIEITVKGKKQFYSDDNLLRIYALSLNDVQAERLRKKGFDSKVIDEIKNILDDDLIEFADKVVEYFSGAYYESVNDVFSSVNNINLGYVDNYFPTRSEGKSINQSWLDNGQFVKIFDAETSPAFRDRTDTSKDIDLSLRYGFTDVMNEHIDNMEKYKAFAQGVKDLNAIVTNDAVDVLFKETGLDKVVFETLNSVINPTYGLDQMTGGFLNKVFNAFTGYALSFKAIQIPKQATSFVNALEEYQYFPDRKTPGLDHIMFMLDSLYTLANIRTEIKKAKDISASFTDRIEKGLEGDLHGLETGGPLKLLSVKKASEYRKQFRKAKGAPTVLGDVLGVMGYMANYRRNIKNGMSPEEALVAFNNYNATQQSRRGTDKIKLQRNRDVFTRAVTMFGSTGFLQLNKVATGLSAIMKRIAEGDFNKAFISKEARAVAINVGVANFLFVFVANMAKYMMGDEEDKEEVAKRSRDALVGLNLLYQVPLAGAALELALARSRGERGRETSIVNPFMSIVKETIREFEKGEGIKGGKPVVEILLGTKIDPAIGLYNLIEKGELEEDDLLDLFGISSSYRPKPDKPMSKTQMKLLLPELYEQMYGKDSDYYKLQQEFKKLKQ
jgi:Trp operon repressor